MEQFDNREKDSVGSSRIRGRWMWESWDDAELYHIGKQYDVLVFQKVYWDKMLNSFDGIKILDLCDPDWLEGKNVMEYISMCDYCTTSTESLAQYIRKFVSTPVRCVPDRIKIDEHKTREKHIGKARKVVWFGYSHNQDCIRQTLETLAEYALELHVISNQPYTPPLGFDFVNIVNHTYSYPQAHEIIKQCDLYISPERSDARGKFKSNNKELTAMALGVPVIRTSEDLDRLINESERNEQMESDLKEIKDKWDVRYSVEDYKEIINEISKHKSKRK